MQRNQERFNQIDEIRTHYFELRQRARITEYTYKIAAERRELRNLEFRIARIKSRIRMYTDERERERRILATGGTDFFVD